MNKQIGDELMKVTYHDDAATCGYIEQMKYTTLDYGIWYWHTLAAAVNHSTICIWKIKWKLNADTYQRV